MKRIKNKFVELRLVLRCLTFKRTYHYFLSLFGKCISYIVRKNIIISKPWALTIEPSSVCQLTCPECLVGQGQIHRIHPFMEMNLFNRILMQLPSSVFYINLYWQGEPLLDKTIFDKISILKKKKLFVALSTNAQNITPNIADQIVRSGLDKIIISMDGTDEEIYQRYRRGGRFQNIIFSLQALHESKKKLKRFTPLIEVQFLLFDYIKKEEIIKKLRYFPHDLIKFKQVQSYSRPLTRMKKKIVCSKLHEYLVVSTTGDIVPCCQDKLLHHTVSNVYHSSLILTWKNKKLENFRKKVNHSLIYLCHTCHFAK
ncbi:MAG: radical SAM protein [Bacteroidales bacterium]|nr:radical SAM protein [Bacteroidales bacterium]